MNGNVIRTITIQGKAEGVDKVTGDLNKLAAAQENVAVVSEQSAKRVLSLETAWQKQTLRLDEAARAQANMAREQKLADAALRQGLATQQQYAERLDLINQKYGQATVAQKAFATATSGVSAQLTAMAAGAGPVGVFLSALGPWGIAAAAGLGAVEAVFDRLSEGAKRIGDKSIELRKFSDVTGLTVTQVKALTKSGGELGVSSETMETAIERFSVGLNEAHKATGSMFEQIRAINPELAMELANTKSTAQGWDVLARALKEATSEAQRNALARAAFGRGGLEAGLVAIQSANAGGLDAQADKIAKATGLTKEWVTETARLRAENIELEKSIKNTMEAAYALPVLQRQNEYLKGVKAINDELIKGNIVKSMVERTLTAGAGGFTGAQQFNEDIEAARVAPPTQGQRGPSEGAMAAQEEAKAQHELADSLRVVEQARADTLAGLEQSNNLDKARIGVLGEAADATDKLALRLNELAVAQLQGTISGEDFERANGAIQQQIGYVEQLREKYGFVNDAVNKQLESLNQQIALAQTRTGVEAQNLQYQQSIANAMGTQTTVAEATAIAEAQRKLSEEQVNKELDQTLHRLHGQGELLAQAGDRKSEKAKNQLRITILKYDPARQPDERRDLPAAA